MTDTDEALDVGVTADPVPVDPEPHGSSSLVDPDTARRSQGGPAQVLGAAVRRIGHMSWASVATGAVVAACAGFVFLTVHPSLIFTENTPTGGDMGSHVWGPMYLMREVLPQWRLTGWSSDWYSGFPAFQFYMVVPMLAIVVLHVGVPAPLLIVALPVAMAVVPVGWFVPRLQRYRWVLFGLATFLTVLVLPVPYGVSFKLVAVAGPVAMPVAAWALGRLAGAPFPVPPALALGSLFFLYNLEPTLNSGTGNIIGGNLTSTMAGEFSFTISLTVGLVYLGFLIRGLRTGRGRGIAAVLLALCGLCHIIPAFYMLAATVLALVIWPGRARLRWFLPVGPVAGLLAAFWVVPFAGRAAYVNDMGWEPLPHTNGDTSLTVWGFLDGRAHVVALLLGGAVGAAALGGLAALLGRRWAGPGAVMGAVAGGLLVRVALANVSAREAGRLPAVAPAEGGEAPQTIFSYLAPEALRIPLILAVVGLVVGAVFGQRLAYLLGGLVVVGAAGFVWVPDGRLWNARLLPLYYLGLFLLAALGIAEVVRAVAVLISADAARPTPRVGIAVAAPAVVAVILFLGVPLGTLPTSDTTPKGEATLLGLTREHRNPGSFWARYNFRGLEGQLPVSQAADGAVVPNGQGGWPEFRDMVDTMDRLGEDPDHGCGRAFWEFGSERLGSYGTTMAPMMIPYFTDGCIGSMEGLYFESSATTPYHFLVQCSASQAGSCSQRDLAYSGFDLDRALRQLELLGVKYYMAFTPTAVGAADQSDRLTKVAATGPWNVYELDAERMQLVVGLQSTPVVLEGVEPDQDSWLDPSAAWFGDPGRWDVPFASDGPDGWPRVELPATESVVGEAGADGVIKRYGDRTLPAFPAEEVRQAEVSAIEMDADGLSFRVDEPGTPVLVKVSYFPNWQVEGAEGPWRVSPNLMVVVPTERQVTMTYGRTPLDWAAYLLTFFGILALIGLWRLGPVPIAEGLLVRRRRQRREEAEREHIVAWAATPVAGPPDAWPEPPVPDRPDAPDGSGRPGADGSAADPDP